MSGIDCSMTNVLSAQQASLRSEISFTIAAKQLDAQKQQGQAVVKLLEDAVQLTKTVGQSGRFDALA